MRQVCDKLNVPLEIVPLSRQYWDRVVSNTVEEIKAGRTPNPDLLCNSRVKFGAFVEFLEQTNRWFDRIASGHYARITREIGPDGEEKVQLKLSADAVKDQTYFLAQLNHQRLSQCIFPLGEKFYPSPEIHSWHEGSLKKKDVRQLASLAGLPTSKRKDSQGICFLGKVKFNEFVERHLGTSY